jgi:hypothetical protein
MFKLRNFAGGLPTVNDRQPHGHTTGGNHWSYRPFSSLSVPSKHPPCGGVPLVSLCHGLQRGIDLSTGVFPLALRHP